MPITIDGGEVQAVTIDSQEVEEITMDGDVVYSIFRDGWISNVGSSTPVLRSIGGGNLFVGIENRHTYGILSKETGDIIKTIDTEPWLSNSATFYAHGNSGRYDSTRNIVLVAIYAYNTNHGQRIYYFSRYNIDNEEWDYIHYVSDRVPFQMGYSPVHQRAAIGSTGNVLQIRDTTDGSFLVSVQPHDGAANLQNRCFDYYNNYFYGVISQYFFNVYRMILTKIDTDGDEESSVLLAGDGANAGDVAIDEARNRLYVTDDYNLRCRDLNLGAIWSVSAGTGGFDRCVYNAEKDLIYVACVNNNEIRCYDTNGGLVWVNSNVGGVERTWTAHSLEVSDDGEVLYFRSLSTIRELNATNGSTNIRA